MVAFKFELRHRAEPLGRSGMANDKNKFVFAGSGRVESEIMFGAGGLVVLVDPEEGEVEVVSRKSEVVGIAAVERRLSLRRHHQPHIRIALIAIEPVFAAAVQRDNGAMEPRLVGCLFLDSGNFRFSPAVLLMRRSRGVDRTQNPRRDVAHGHQHGQLGVVTAQFLRPLAREEPVLDIVVL